jgi:hypothetical protein
MSCSELESGLRLSALHKGNRGLHSEERHISQDEENGTWTSHAGGTLIEESQGKRPFARLKRRWEDNIKMYIKLIGYRLN